MNEGPVYLEVAGITKIRKEGNRAYLRGFLSYAFRSIREDIPGVVPIPNMIKSKGRWKWFGTPPYTILLDRDVYFEAEIPNDAADFLRECENVFTGDGSARRERCFAEGFSYRGMNRDDVLETIRSFTKNNKAPEIQLTRWYPSNGLVEVDGHLHNSDIGQLKLPPGIALKKEKSDWKWFGEAHL